MVYSLQEYPDGNLKVTLISKNARLVTEKPVPTSPTLPSSSTSSLVSPTPDVVPPATEASSSIPPVATTSSQIMYSDEESTPFFRRLAFSTDGALLVTPAGQYEDPYASSSGSISNKKSKKPTSTNGTDADASVVIDSSSPIVEKKPHSKLNGPSSASNVKLKNRTLGPSSTSYAFARGQFANETPVAHLPGHRTASIVVKFNPVLWKLRDKNKKDSKGKGKEKAIEEGAASGAGAETMEVDSGSNAEALTARLDTPAGQPASNSEDAVDTPGIFQLKKRTIYAVATHDTILLYDTQQEAPICMFSSLHFAAFTDLAWYVVSHYTTQDFEAKR